MAVPGGLPADVQITLGSSNPANQPDQLVAQFTIDAAAMTDYDFNVLFRATAAEESNGDTEIADSDPLRVLINYTHNEATLNHVVTDQSIWNTGDAFVYDLHEFLGVDTSDFLDPSGGFLIEDPVFGTDILEVSYDAYLKAGFQIDVHFEAGDIDANIPVDLTIDTTYNKTTDKIYLTSTVATGSGGSFTTQGPQGSLNLDFIFNYLLGGTFDLIGFDPLVLGPYGQDYTYNIIGIDTEDPDADSFTWDVPPFTVEIAWPQIAVTNAPGTMSGSGESNPILNLTADIDQIANFILGGALSFLDDAPSNTEDDFELADLDLAGALKLLQDFAIAVGTSQSVTVILEDGDTFEMIFGTPLTIDDASSHDVDNDGNVSMSFDFTPEVELTNSTSIGVELSIEVALVRNLDVFGYDFTLYDPDPFPIFETGFEVFNETFALQGVGSANYGFIA